MALTMLASTCAHSQQASDQLVLRFRPGIVTPPPRTAGALDEFSFSDPALRQALAAEGVVRLARMFPNFRSSDRFSTNLIGEPVVLDDLSEFYLASFGTGAWGSDSDRRLRSIRGIEYSGWPQLRQASYVPNDTHFPQQWGHHNTAQSFCTPYNGPPPVADSIGRPTDINAPEAWDIEKGLNPSVRVGVIDSGILASHFDFGGRVNPDSGITFVPVEPQWACSPWPCPCVSCSFPSLSCDFNDPEMDPHDDMMGHGTAVAGIIAGSGDNEAGVAGIAWGVSPIAIKIITCENSSASCLSARALDWARAKSIPILNMSYGGGGADEAERSAARNAFYKGQLLVGASGNGGSLGIAYPANYQKTVCSVGAFFVNGRRWIGHLIFPSSVSGSTYGPGLDLSAPGGAMISTTSWGLRCSDNAYFHLAGCNQNNMFGGTSSAAPVVSGVAALLLSKYPGLLGEDLYQGMIRTAMHPGSMAGRDTTFDDLTTAFLDDSAGFGHVRADTVLKFFAPPRQTYHQRVTRFAVIDTFTTQRTLRNVPGLPNPDSVYTVRCYVLRKTVSFSPAFVSMPFAWARSSGTAGLKNVNPYDYNEEVNFGQIVALSPTQCTVETNVFKVLNLADPFFHFWLPVLPTKAAVALTMVGEPAGSGPLSSVPAPSETGHAEAADLPTAFALRQSQPNPLEGETTIRFELPVRTAARLDVFDAQGRLVRTLANAEFSRGLHTVRWDGRDSKGRVAKPGIYLYRLRAGSFRDQKKMMLPAR